MSYGLDNVPKASLCNAALLDDQSVHVLYNMIDSGGKNEKVCAFKINYKYTEII